MYVNLTPQSFIFQEQLVQNKIAKKFYLKKVTGRTCWYHLLYSDAISLFTSKQIKLIKIVNIDEESLYLLWTNFSGKTCAMITLNFIKKKHDTEKIKYVTEKIRYEKKR